MAQLERWRPADPDRERLRRTYLGFLDARGSRAADRDGGPDHLTASCFVFSPDLAETLLCFHRKGRFWVQPGGHLEPADRSVTEAALREAREETGLTTLGLVPGLLDLDRHALSASFGACRTHWDVGVAAVARRAEPPRASAESDSVGWFPVDALPEPLADRVAARVHAFRDLVTSVERGSAGARGCAEHAPETETPDRV